MFVKVKRNSQWEKTLHIFILSYFICIKQEFDTVVFIWCTTTEKIWPDNFNLAPKTTFIRALRRPIIDIPLFTLQLIDLLTEPV